MIPNFLFFINPSLDTFPYEDLDLTWVIILGFNFWHGNSFTVFLFYFISHVF